MDLTPDDVHVRGLRFRQLHEGPRAFVIPNPWDAGTARLMARSGFAALATTSAGHAFSNGIPDGDAALDALLDHAASIVAATDLPVSVDLEDGYAPTSDGIAAVIAAVAAQGAVGASIEDRRRAGELASLEEAADRVEAAVAAARSQPFPFTVTARCECFLAGHPDLPETIRRLQAYESAGADVLYAPGLTTHAQVAAVVAAVGRPVNVLAGIGTELTSVAELEALGVRRISVGSALSRVAFGAVQRALKELATGGTFRFARDAMPYAELNEVMAR